MHTTRIDTITIPSELDELRDLLEPTWPELRRVARLEGPVCEGESGGEGGGGEQGGDGGGDKGGEGNPAGGDGGDGGKGGEDDGDDATAKLAKERDAAKEAAATKDRELRELRRANDERERKEREAGGKFEELYRAEADKVGKLEARIEELEGEVEKVGNERKKDGARNLALEALRGANAKNATKAVVHLDLDNIDSEAKARKAVAKLKEEDGYLFDETPTRQARGGGESDEGGESSGTDDNDKILGPARLRRAFAGQGESRS